MARARRVIGSPRPRPVLLRQAIRGPKAIPGFKSILESSIHSGTASRSRPRKPTKEESIRQLAEIHYQVEPGMTAIYRIKNQNVDEDSIASEPIKLLEVNRNTIAAGVMPLFFGALPARGIHYPSVIIEITPAEYRRLGKTKKLRLPVGWVISGGPIARPAQDVDE